MNDIVATLLGPAIAAVFGYIWYKKGRNNTLKDRASDKKEKQDEKKGAENTLKIKTLTEHKEFLVGIKNEFGVNFIVQTLDSTNPNAHLNSKLAPIKKGTSSLKVFAEQDAPKILGEVDRLIQYISNVETLMLQAIQRKAAGEHSFNKGPLNEAVKDCHAVSHRLKVDIDSMLSKFGL
ncbi:hypothetical protein K6U21_15200 [Vibrio vulnificus]|uniref:hypothetical protein n=1 Tax=Vibrio vulnificus TaxID=672 RepID=UPI001EEC2300|nr:hypothetical protein [Vibrio vulnificus]MCG6305508.1 hypothetical protein [Vibrio vulnificus]